MKKFLQNQVGPFGAAVFATVALYVTGVYGAETWRIVACIALIGPIFAIGYWDGKRRGRS